MFSPIFISSLLLFLFSYCNADLTTHPHIIFFLVDDLGWANTEIHATANEVQTPHTKALSQKGIILNRHYTFRFCSPTRSALLSGRLPIHVNQMLPKPTTGGRGIVPNMTLLPKKLKQAGYSTHHVGKWHCGSSLKSYLPINRGFDSSFGFLGGGEDHWNHTTRGWKGGPKYTDLWRDHGPAKGYDGVYCTYMYVEEIRSIVTRHAEKTDGKPNDVPLFLYYALHNVHWPLETPEKYINPYSDVKNYYRQMGDAQSSVMDDALGNVTHALKAANMWENTLLIYSSDNGGPLAQENNYPLRGGKMGAFEGGVRVTAFMAGGIIPSEKRGTQLNGYIHIVDWYATLCYLAGVDPEDNIEGIPGIDSINMWPFLTGQNITSPRTEIPLQTNALISGEWKIITGVENTPYRCPILWPNGTATSKDPVPKPKPRKWDCGSGCLFNIIDDPGETHNQNESNPKILKQMQKRLTEIQKTIYQSPETNQTKEGAAAAALARGGFWGPWPNNT